MGTKRWVNTNWSGMWACSLLLMSMLGAVQAREKVYYVDARVEESGDGSSWTLAYADLQDALYYKARNGGEVRVAQGTYYPSESGRDGRIRSLDSDTQDYHFDIAEDTIVKGGYGGISESDPNVRDPEKFPTILSGDHLQNDPVNPTTLSLTTSPYRADNSKVIVDMGPKAVLDGLIIEGAIYTGCTGYHDYPITFRKCIFRHNGSMDNDEYGGAITGENETFILEHCIFINNASFMGGAVRMWGGELQIRDCRFERNSAQEAGGAVYCSGPSLYCLDSLFLKNESLNAGVFYSDADQVMIDRCRFLGNAAQEDSVCQFNAGKVILRNSLFSGNLVVNSGEVVTGDNVQGIGLTFVNNLAPSIAGLEAVVHNSILWDEQMNPDEDYGRGHDDSIPTLNHCNLMIPWSGPGQGNISADPCFVDALGMDGLAGTEDDDCRLMSGSPCINAGRSQVSTSEFDLAGEPRVNHIVDMGAYEHWQVWHVDADSGDDYNGGRVPKDALETIQAAIDRAQDGDTILVHPAIYPNDVVFRGKAVHVKGLVGPAGCPILSLGQRGCGCRPEYYPRIVFDANEGPDSILEHFIIEGLDVAISLTGSSPTLRYLTVVYNRIGLEASRSCFPEIKHCIFWDNSTHDLVGVTPTYSCVERPLEGDGAGCIHTDPLFIDPNRYDYHLQSVGGRYDPNYANWVQDTQTSPCIGAGDPNTPVTQQSLSYSTQVNLGAYGQTAQASRLPRQAPIVAFLDLEEGEVVSRSDTIKVTAHDWDGQVLGVEFKANGQSLGWDTDSTDGWTTQLDQAPDHDQLLISAGALDSHGLMGQARINVELYTGGRGGR